MWWLRKRRYERIKDKKRKDEKLQEREDELFDWGKEDKIIKDKETKEKKKN